MHRGQNILYSGILQRDIKIYQKCRHLNFNLLKTIKMKKPKTT